MVSDASQQFEQLAHEYDPSWVNGKWQPKSMMLQTIGNENKNKDRFLKETNKTDDIIGAQPKRIQGFDKPCLHSVEDIEGARPRRLHVKMNKPVLYDVSDIDGAKPATRTFHSRRCVNPLSPKYKLASYDYEAAPVPKFYRNGLDFSDVDGTRAKPKREYKTRDIMNIRDIEYSGPTYHHKYIPPSEDDSFFPVSSSPYVEDITRMVSHMNKEGTNPLRPVYVVNDMRIEDEKYTFPRRTKTPNKTFYGLTTSDIAGAQSTSGFHVFPHMKERRHFRNVNDVSDVAGAKADTLSRGLKTKRQTDPLNPHYILLDGQRFARSARGKHSASTPNLSARPSTRGGNVSSRSSNSNQFSHRPKTSGSSGRRSGRKTIVTRIPQRKPTKSEFKLPSPEAMQAKGIDSPQHKQLLSKIKSNPSQRLQDLENKQASQLRQLQEYHQMQRDILHQNTFDHLTFGAGGLAPSNNSFEIHPMHKTENRSSEDHFENGLNLTADTEEVIIPKVSHPNNKDHLGIAMIPEDETAVPDRGRKQSVLSQDQQENIAGWEQWVQNKRKMSKVFNSTNQKRPETAMSRRPSVNRVPTPHSIRPESIAEGKQSEQTLHHQIDTKSDRQSSNRGTARSLNNQPKQNETYNRVPTPSVASHTSNSMQQPPETLKISARPKTSGRQRHGQTMPQHQSVVPDSRPKSAIPSNVQGLGPTMSFQAKYKNSTDVDRQIVKELPEEVVSSRS